MKAIIILLVCVVAGALAQWEGMPCAYNNGDGRPYCNAAELAKQYWRNNWDNHHFWYCANLNEPAVKGRCPDGHLYDSSKTACVLPEDYEFTHPCNPPSVW